jgi:hypothetical protein
MIIKPKMHKIALVSITMVLMLISTAGAFPFCGCGCGAHYRDHSRNDKSSDESSNKCIVCPACPTCPICAAPGLIITKTGSITGKQDDAHDLLPIITYNYTLINIGNEPLTGMVIYDNKTNAITVPGTLAPSATVPANATYYTTRQDRLQGYVTNSAIGTGTAIGSLIQVASNPAFNQTIIPNVG